MASCSGYVSVVLVLCSPLVSTVTGGWAEECIGALIAVCMSDGEVSVVGACTMFVGGVLSHATEEVAGTLIVPEFTVSD